MQNQAAIEFRRLIEDIVNAFCANSSEFKRIAVESKEF